MKRIRFILPLFLVLIGLNGFAQYDPPQNFQCELLDGLVFTWNAPEVGLPIGYNIYRNGDIINDALISDLQYIWFGWYFSSCCPAEFEIEAIYTNGVSEPDNILFPESISGGIIEPLMIGGDCFGFEIIEGPSALCACNLIGIYYDGVIGGWIDPENISNINYATLPLENVSEICISYFYDECVVSTCCTVPISTSIEESPMPEITLFPQPATTNINLTSTIPIMEVEILNLTGEIVNTFNLDGAKEWNTNINHLDAGIYIVRYVFENKDETFRKMIVR